MREILIRTVGVCHHQHAFAAGSLAKVNCSFKVAFVMNFEILTTCYKTRISFSGYRS